MEKRLDKIPFGKVRSDDILISGRNDVGHLENLKLMLSIVKWNRLRKCVFLGPEVTYLGFRINKLKLDGVLSLPEKVEKCLKPKTITKFKSFLGLINYYHRHLPIFFIFPGTIILFIMKRIPIEMNWKRK